MTRFYLVRHGQTAWNKEQRFRGRADVPLDEVGLAECRALAQAHRETGFDALYASPLTRCRQTLEPLARLQQLEIQPLDALVDIDFGDWQGRPKDELREEQPELFEQWMSQPEQVTFPGGENLTQVRERALAAVGSIHSEHPDGTVIVCTHRVVCKLLVCGLVGIPDSRFWRIRQDATCVNLFEISLHGTATLVTLNDTHHTRDVAGSGTLADF